MSDIPEPDSYEITVSATPTPLVSRNPKRIGLVFRNQDGANAVRIGGRARRATRILAGGTFSLDQFAGAAAPFWADPVAGTPIIEVLEVFEA